MIWQCRCRASSMARDVLPLPVAPVMIMAVPPGWVYVSTTGLGNDAGDLDDDFCGFFHGGDGYVFVASMEVESAGKDVGAGQSFEGELCSVCAAAYGYYFGRDAAVAHGLFGCVDDVHQRFDFFAHVVVLVFDFDGAAVGKFVVDFACEVFHLFFASFEAVAVVVSYDVCEHCFFDGSFHAYEVVESFVSFGVFGGFPSWEHDDKLVGYAHRVYHFVFGVSRVYVASGEGDACDSGVEVFVFEFAYFAAVHGVCPVGTEELDIEFVCALADFLVGVEGYAYFAVFDFGMLLEVVYGGDDFGDACLVVGSKQCIAVGDDECLSFVVEQFGKVVGRQGDAGMGVEQDVSAVIVLDDARGDVVSAHIGGCVEVCDKSDGGNAFGVGIGG